ncbi:lysophospholipid acyltransferase family protein [uncultured Tenacibaculum sp.]|uniref:lysophospholipid acyltransferase family protein n=1 Tax=uncultured Tenacibaculum sp. TaxID=174713 RepID=UPI0026113A41|nr:lysophospholipid acyltransferase family protein [uncultured Tenacibaculum sp.]
MKYILFLIIYPIVWCLSRLPMRLLYMLSDFLFFLVYYIVGYRKDVVYNNLKLAFPEKTDKELKILRKKSLRHFGDFIVESIKAFSLTEKQARKRYKFVNPEVLNEVGKQGKNIILTGAHFNNWEWSVSMPLVSDVQIYGAYTTIKNPYFEKFVKSSRTKFGLIAYKTKDIVPNMVKNIKSGKIGAYILLSDQSPVVHKTYHWQKFFGVKVPVHTGAELLAKKFDMAVINYTTKKIKRGYYETTFELITNTPKDFEDYQIIDKYLKITEKSIREQPENYLWTHKRFKHKEKYDMWVEKFKRE